MLGARQYTRNPKRFPSHGILLLILSLSALPTSAGAEEGVRPRLFLETGGLYGREAGAPPYYTTSSWRIHSEVGLDWRRKPRGARDGSFGFAVTFDFGQDDLRLGLGPRYTRWLDDTWGLQAMGGIVTSSAGAEPGALAAGVQLRTSLLWRDLLALDVVWQRLPWHQDLYQNDGTWRTLDGTLDALYGGLSFRGAAGAIATGAWAAMIVVTIVWYLTSYAD